MVQMHPLSALTGDEILLASSVVRASYPEGTKLRFKGISLFEPPKPDVQEYRRRSIDLPRKAWVNYYLTGTVRILEFEFDETC